METGKFERRERVSVFQVYEVLERSGLFDHRYYVEKYPDVPQLSIDPLLHYIELGAGERRDPGPAFDTQFYLEQCRKVGEDPANPLYHFVSKGMARGFLGWRETAPTAPANVSVEPDGIEATPQTRTEPAPLAGEEDLLYYIEDIKVGHRLRLDGWLFDRITPIRSIFLFVDHGMTRKKVLGRCGRPRADVMEAFGVDTAFKSGFSVQSGVIQESGFIGLECHFDDGSIRDISVAKVSINDANNAPSLELLTPRCGGVTSSDSTLATSRFARSMFVRDGSLGTVLRTFVPMPVAPDPLPEPVVILVAVYRGRQYLVQFFASLFAHTSPSHPVIIIDDGNTDPAITGYLRSIAASHSNVRLVKNPKNIGYVKSMCVGLENAPPGHFVVVNTDTVLPPGWLERLMEPIFRDPTIASTTPFTNAGNICSFPSINSDNPIFLGLDVDDIDAQFARIASKTFEIELPSAVGFCTGINRSAVDRIGWFDSEAFSRGYGEENDWCLRAVEAGFRNVLVPNLFVYHKHGGSFLSDEKQVLLKQGQDVVRARYPQYTQLVEEFSEVDPPAPLRALAALLIFGVRMAKGCYVIIDHGLGGGAGQYLETILDDLRRTGTTTLLVEPDVSSNSISVRIEMEGVVHTFAASDWRDLISLLGRVKIREIILNNLVGYSSVADNIADLLAVLSDDSIKLRLMVHDFFWLCPSVNLINHKDVYCELPRKTICDRCASRNRHFMLEPGAQHSFKMDMWRRTMQGLFDRATEIRCFSESTRGLLQQAMKLPSDRVSVVPHILTGFAARQIAISARQRLHVGVIGRINEAKGSEVVYSLAAAIKKSKADVGLTVFGGIVAPKRAGIEKVEVFGPYERVHLSDEIERRGVNLILIPSIWPETFCYAAEEAMALGLPTIVFDVGAPAERVRLYKLGLVLPTCDREDLLEAIATFFKRVTLPAGTGDARPNVKPRRSRLPADARSA